MDGGSGVFESVTASPSPTVVTVSAPVLTASAIANIICSVLAVVFLSVLLCYMVHSYNRDHNRTRIRTALANNKLIDQQNAAAKARAEERTQAEPTRSETVGNTSTASTTNEPQDYLSQPQII